ncbi:unnamed protein product [marine sediment metagenome]|uniref:Arginosuccinate synthase-like N-terminal domain-containing protein n=1 Tax=marine sediment metagenome TaxID=412755 RepID=X1FTK6_9ZZZZ
MKKMKKVVLAYSGGLDTSVAIKWLKENYCNEVIAPAREWGFTRDEEIKYAKKYNIPVPVDVENPYSVDQNLWGRSITCNLGFKAAIETSNLT